MLEDIGQSLGARVSEGNSVFKFRSVTIGISGAFEIVPPPHPDLVLVDEFTREFFLTLVLLEPNFLGSQLHISVSRRAALNV